MKKSKPIFGLLLAILLLSPAIAFSQAFSDTVTVDLQLFIPDAGIFFLNDLNLTNLGNAPLLFAITIDNYFYNAKTLVLHFGIRRDAEILIDGKTEEFVIGPFPAKIYLTSQNILSEGGQYSLQNFEITDATDELKNTILSQGKLPTGVYQFFIQIDYEKYNISQRIVIDEEDITINAPTTLDLIAPGQPADNGDAIELYTTLPFFQWHSNASQFRITVCEKLPTNVSPSDAMNNEPRIQQVIDNFSFFQYPASGAWPLEEGKTYYWQVAAIIPSTSGPVDLESEIWGFKIGNLSGGSFSLEHQQLLAYLISFFGEAGLGELFEAGGALDGFTFTGVMLNNNSTMTMDDLNALIQKLISKNITIDNYLVE